MCLHVSYFNFLPPFFSVFAGPTFQLLFSVCLHPVSASLRCRSEQHLLQEAFPASATRSGPRLSPHVPPPCPAHTAPLPCPLGPARGVYSSRQPSRTRPEPRGSVSVLLLSSSQVLVVPCWVHVRTPLDLCSRWLFCLFSVQPQSQCRPTIQRAFLLPPPPPFLSAQARTRPVCGRNPM